MFADKDGNTLHPVSGSSGRIEEKTRRLLAGGEGLDQKIKKKRSVGAVGSRMINSDRDMKRPTHPKLSADTKLRSCDAHGFRYLILVYQTNSLFLILFLVQYLYHLIYDLFYFILF